MITNSVECFESTGHWIYNTPIPTNTFGFIYKITNNHNGRMYIGKKQIQRKVKMPPLKGRKNKRIKICESDWKAYTGSCNELNEHIEQHGKDNFTFEILQLCESKWELSYEEAKLQFQVDVLVNESYYNGIINCRIGKKYRKKLQ